MAVCAGISRGTVNTLFLLVEPRGIEPLTFALRTRRSRAFQGSSLAGNLGRRAATARLPPRRKSPQLKPRQVPAAPECSSRLWQASSAFPPARGCGADAVAAGLRALRNDGVGTCSLSRPRFGERRRTGEPGDALRSEGNPKVGSQKTPRRREMDSNSRFRARETRFRAYIPPERPRTESLQARRWRKAG